MNNGYLLERTESFLAELGMDRERSNERSAMTFLALAHMDDDTPWSDATNEMYTTRQIMDWIRDRLGVEYAANTRETIRRFTLHQFVAGGIVQYNADDPNRPTNSPKNNYRIAPPLMPVIHAIDTPRYAVFTGVAKELVRRGEPIDHMVEKADSNPVSKTLKLKVKDELERLRVSEQRVAAREACWHIRPKHPQRPV